MAETAKAETDAPATRPFTNANYHTERGKHMSNVTVTREAPTPPPPVTITLPVGHAEALRGLLYSCVAGEGSTRAKLRDIERALSAAGIHAEDIRTGSNASLRLVP